MMDDDAYRDHVRRLRDALRSAPAHLYTHRDTSPERNAARQAIVDDAWAELGGDDIPKGRQGLILAGLPGSGKTQARQSAEVPGVGPVSTHFLPIDSDYFKGKLIDAGLAPSLPGFSPMETAPLMHKESNDLAKALARRAYQSGTNVAWDYTLRHPHSPDSRMNEFDDYGYTPHGIYVHADPATALARVTKRHRDDLEAYLNGWHPHGGRYVPPEIIGDSVYGGRVANRDNYDRLAPNLATSQIFDTTDFDTGEHYPRQAHRTAMPAPMPEGMTFHHYGEDDRLPKWMRKLDIDLETPAVEARHNGKPVGYLAWDYDRYPAPTSIYTDPNYRRQGIATALWDFARQHEPDLEHSEHLTDLGEQWVRHEQSRTAARSLDELAQAGYVTDDWGKWQQGGCIEYAHALKERYPHLRAGVISTPGDEDDWQHIFMHDDTHAYDSAGSHPLPYAGVHNSLEQHLDHDLDWYDEPDPDLLEQAHAHIDKHGIGPRTAARRTAGISDQPDDVTDDYSLAEFLQWCAVNRRPPSRDYLAQYAAISGMDTEDYLDIYLFLSREAGLRRTAADDGPQRLLTLADIAPHLGIDRFTLYQLADPKKRAAPIPTPTHRAGPYALWDSPEPWVKWNAIRKGLANNLGQGGAGGGYKAGPTGGGWGNWAEDFQTGEEPIQLYTAGQIADYLGVHRNQVKYWASRAAAGLMAGPPPPHTHEMPRGDKGLTQRLWDDLDGWSDWHHTKVKPGSPEVVRPGDTDLLAREFTPPSPKLGPVLPPDPQR